MFSKIQKFTDSTDFTNAFKVTISAVIPVLLFSHLGDFKTGLTIALGAFFTFPSDIPSNLKHKINGLLVTILIISGVNVAVNISYPYPLLFYPLLTVLIFILSMLSVYGQRATMVAFSALLSISLSFSHINTGWEMILHAALLLAGGLFYLLISLLFYYISPHRYIELQIAECIKLTAKYLKLRGDLWKINSDRKEITNKQLLLQVDLNAIHENIREILVRNRTNYGSSNQNRKMLLAFMSLVEIMELAVSTSFDHNKLHQKFDNHPNVLMTYQKLAYNLAQNLKQLANSIQERLPYVPKNNLINDLHALELVIIDYKNSLDEETSPEGVLMLTNMLHYAEKQIEKIKTLERAYTSNVNLRDIKKRVKDLEKLIKPHYYPLNTFVENFRFSSTVFRHSLRITITILAGYILGKILPFQNVYWILLTIVVIMRPGYGLTKERTFQRFFGTIMGGIVAFGILSLHPNTSITGSLAVIFMVLGFSFNPTNYKIGTTFITIHVIFIFAILTPDFQEVIQYRILDTLVGGILAFLANYFLWPTWEFLNIHENIEKSIIANRNYLKQISILYNNKEAASTPYRLARNQAFIEIGNLMASFQRMVQEPKSKQNKLPHVYKLTVLNNALLSSAASLGTYTQSHKTTEASASFNIVVDKIIKNLDYAILLLKGSAVETMQDSINENLNKSFIELKNIRINELKREREMNDEAFGLKMQEAQLVIEQLIWLTNLSDNIVNSTTTLLTIKNES